MSVGVLTVSDKEAATTTAKIANDLVRKAKLIAPSRGVTLSDLLSGWIRPIIDREYPKAAQKMLDEGPPD